MKTWITHLPGAAAWRKTCGVVGAFYKFLLKDTEDSSQTRGLSTLTDLEDIIAERPSYAMRSLHFFILGFFAILILITSLRQVEIVVGGSGRLATDAPPIVLQPMDRSIISELKVKVGDVVTKGQVLATLDPTFAEADMASLTAQQRGLLTQIRRLEAELNGKPYVVRNGLDPDDALQAMLYAQRQAQYASRLRNFDEDVQRLDADIRSSEANTASLGKQLAVAKDLEGMRESLYQSQNGSKLNLLDSQTLRLRTEREYQDTINHRDEVRHSILSKKAERQTFIDDWRRQLLEELVRARMETTKTDENLSKATRIHNLVVVTAPEDAVVLEVARRSVGSVLQGGEPLITMVPSNATLIAEITLSSGDVGYTKPGDKVVVKIDAFPYQKHGALEGRVRSINEESFDTGMQKQANTSFGGATSGAGHHAQIELVTTKLDNLPEGSHLIPGMTLGAEIQVGSRSVISYFLYPLRRGFSESISEP